MKSGYEAYRDVNVDTADQGKLILIAYDVAIKNCKLAIEKFEGKEYIEQRTKHLIKVQDAVSELMSSLKMDVGKISHNLYAIYDYMVKRLVHANAHNDLEAVREVLRHLTSLRSAWAEAAQKVKQEISSQQADGVSNQNLALSG